MQAVGRKLAQSSRAGKIAAKLRMQT